MIIKTATANRPDITVYEKKALLIDIAVSNTSSIKKATEKKKENTRIWR